MWTSPIRSSFLCYMWKLLSVNHFFKFIFNVLISGLTVCTRAQLLEMVGGSRQCMFNCHQAHFVCRSAQSMGVKRGDKDNRVYKPWVPTKISQCLISTQNSKISFNVHLIDSKALSNLFLATSSCSTIGNIFARVGLQVISHSPGYQWLVWQVWTLQPPAWKLLCMGWALCASAEVWEYL